MILHNYGAKVFLILSVIGPVLHITREGDKGYKIFKKGATFAVRKRG